MSAHRAAADLYLAPIQLKDPGNAGSIKADRGMCFVQLVSAAAETRTLARPERIGVMLTLHMKTDGGDITLTVTGGFNETGDTTFTFSDPGQWATFISCYDGTNYFWRLSSHYGLGNASPTEAASLDGLTATAAEINQWCDESVKTETVTTTNVLAASESGKTCYLASATEFVSTLPAPAAGLFFRFIVAAAPSGASYTVVTNSSANIMLGHVLTSQDAGGTADSETSGGDTLSFVDSKAVVGDMAEFFCDGTNWFVRASCKVFDAITITTAS